jgi:hypothetical protein
VLVIMAERWKQATTYRDTFETLSEKTISMICSDQAFSANMMPTLEPLVGNAADEVNQSTMLQGWTMGLNDLAVPNDSEWFVQELLQGMRDFQQPEITYDDLADFTH